MIARLRVAFWWCVWLVIRVYAFTRPLRRIQLAGSPYIDRWFLTSQPEPGKTGTPGWYLQRIHRADADPRLHNHPWEVGDSTILRGGYFERRQFTTVGFPSSRAYGPGDRNHLTPSVFHRIYRVRGECWTLFHAGPKHGSGWGFLDGSKR